jgi:hypothetical protein
MRSQSERLTAEAKVFSLLLCTSQGPRGMAFLDGKAAQIVALSDTPTVKML